MKKPSIKMIVLHLERKEAAACQAFARASERAEVRIIAAVEGIRPFREKFEQARLERAAFAAGNGSPAEEPLTPDPEPEQLTANLSLSSLARALNGQSSSAAPEKQLTAAEPHQASTEGVV